MPRLSDLAIKSAIKTATKAGKGRKLFDELGLFLQLKPSDGSCSSWWRQRYRYAGKEQLLSLGVYPDIGLAQARERRDAIRKQIANGIDPSAQREAQKIEERNAATNTFKAVAMQWQGDCLKTDWTEAHAKRVQRRLEQHVLPWIGAMPIKEVSADEITACIDRIKQRDAADTARRVLQYCKAIFRWARIRKYVETNPVGDVNPEDLKIRTRVTHRAAITNPAELGVLLRAMDAYQGGFVVQCALQLLALTFVRPGELRAAEWPEFVLDGKEPLWRIPAAKMKMGGSDHIVPLSLQAVAVLREIQPLTGSDGKGLVFPGARNASRMLSENTLNMALRTMGFEQQQHCSHGFRGTASTLLNEQQWNRDAIELQLAHMPRDQVRAAYNSATHLPERKKMMQAWADYLDELRKSKS